MSRLHLTFACGDYDRTRALEDGSVRPDGIDLTYLRLPVEETFFRMLRHREFDVAEMSLSTYVATLDHDARPFVALPVFTSRMFRHGGIYINADAGISVPSDLRGKRVASPEFQLTAGVWIRGILAEHHDVPIDSVTYFTGGQETPGRIEKGKVDTGLDIRPIAAGATLARMLVAGEIDALYTPRVPSAFRDRDPRVKRLFHDVVAVEKEYFAATKIFPIMHVVVIRADVYERHRWVRPIAVQGVPARTRPGLRTHLRFVGAALHGAVAYPAPRGVEGTARPGLLVVRARREREGARRVPGIPPRTGTVPQALRARRPVRARGDGSIRHLTLSAAERSLPLEYLREISSGKERSREKQGLHRKTPSMVEITLMV